MDEAKSRYAYGAVATWIVAGAVLVPFLAEPRCSAVAACGAAVSEYQTGVGHEGGTYVPSAILATAVAAGTSSSDGPLRLADFR